MQHFILFNSHPLFYFFLYLHLICVTEAGNHMARIADLTSTSHNFVVSSLNLFLSWICAIFCMLICAFLSLFANFHHIPMENAPLFTWTHVVTAPVYIYDANLSHTSHFMGPLARCRKCIFYCVTVNKILFVSRIVARLSLIPILKGHSPLRRCITTCVLLNKVFYFSRIVARFFLFRTAW